MNEKSGRVLMITPHYPLREGMGVERRAYQHLVTLSKQWTVDLLVLYACRHSQPTGFRHLAGTVIELHMPDDLTHLPDRRWRVPGQVLLRELFRDNSKRARPLGPTQARTLLADLAGRQYTTLFFLRIRAWVFRPALQAVGVTTLRSIIDFDDIESKRNLRIAERLRGELGLEMFLVAKLRHWRLAHFERRALATADTVLLCSDHDRAEVAATSRHAKVETIPNAVSIVAPLPAPCGQEINILFVGTMSYQPNVDAAVFFAREVLPLLAQRCSISVILWLVGYRPAERVRALQAIPNVIVTGAVASVEPFYGAAHVCIAPIRSGGGTRIKILEAFAYGRPVVSTRVGIEGIDATPDQDFLLANDAATFAAACIKLIHDSSLWSRLADNAFRTVRQHYGYACIAPQLNRLVEPAPSADSRHAKSYT